MTPAELIAALARVGAIVTAGPDDRPILDAVMTDDVLTIARRYRWLFVWGLAGAATGHRWHACDRCSEVQLLGRERRCGMTPGCDGTMKPLPDLFGRRARGLAS